MSQTIKHKLNFEAAIAQYVHRFTMEYIPLWAKTPMNNGKFYAPQYRTDKEWYDNTEFPPHNGRRKYCTSNNQSWPLGKELNKPYSITP